MKMYYGDQRVPASGKSAGVMRTKGAREKYRQPMPKECARWPKIVGRLVRHLTDGIVPSRRSIARAGQRTLAALISSRFSDGIVKQMLVMLQQVESVHCQIGT